MTFSILVTSFNDADNFERFFDGIQNQSIKPMELIIADGGSTDGSKDLINGLKAQYDYEIRFIPTDKKLNIAAGYNTAVENCTTEMCVIMGIGNHYTPNFCKSLFEYEKNHKVDFVYSPIVGVEHNAFSHVFNLAFVGGKDGKNFGFASNRGVLISRSVFTKIGLFYEKFIYAGEDTEYFLRANEAGMIAGYDTNTTVFWETPISFNEYMKKNKVNAIADMQMFPKGKILKQIALRTAFLIVELMLLLSKPVVALALLVLLLVAFAVKIRSLDVRAVALRLHFFFLPSYYYIKFWKYTQKQYHFDAEKICYPHF